MTIEVVNSCPAAVLDSSLRFLDCGAASCSLFNEDELRGSRALGRVRAVMVTFRKMFALWIMY